MMLTTLQMRTTRTVFLRCIPRKYHELSYNFHAEPVEALAYQTDPILLDNDPPPSYGDKKDFVKVEMLYVPWNPADVNNVQGKYPSPYASNEDKPSVQSRYFPDQFISGSEGIGRIASTTSTDFSKGSLVTVGKPGLGTLRSSLWVSESSFLSLPEELLEKVGPSSSTLAQLGGTALRMLSDFIPISPGSVVLQNAGNSGVGFMVSQLASELFGSSVVSLVRRGSKSKQEFDELVNYLKQEGGNVLIIAEEDLDDRETMKQFQVQLRELSKTGDLPQLALNAVGGESAKKLLRGLGTGGTLVTYGGMSGQPVITATPQLIFKDARVVGYWHSRWMVQQSQSAKQEMIDTLSKAVLDGKVNCPPVEIFPLCDVQAGLQWQSSQGAIRSKLVWDCREKSL